MNVREWFGRWFRKPAPTVEPAREFMTPFDFWKGRDRAFVDQCTPEIQANGADTIRRVNGMLGDFYATFPDAYTRGCNSGWRPPEVNAATRNAAKFSKHLTAQACDISDDDEMLDRWLMAPAGSQSLERHELWMEHPSATARWAHVQTIAPKSGNRVFYP